MVGEIAIQSVVDVMRFANQFVDEDGRHAVAAVHSDVEVVVRPDKLFLEIDVIGIDVLLLDLAFFLARNRGFITFHQGFQAIQASVVADGKGVFC